MDFRKIQDQIYSLETDEQIKQFVDERINYLEENGCEKTVGQNYTDTFRDYISEKIHYKAAAPFGSVECPDLVYDDRTPYYDIIKELVKYGYNKMSVLNDVYKEVCKYLPNGDEDNRLFVYRANRDKRLSIKTINEQNAAFCSEKSGLAQNIFHILGYDSELVCGRRNGVNHAYNIVFPNGYDNEPMILFDSTNPIKYLNGNEGFNVAFYKALKKDEYDKLLMGMDVDINLDKTDENYRNTYKGIFDNYTMVQENITYNVGLNSKINTEVKKI